MKIIYICPKCGHDLTEYITDLGEPYTVSCDNCGWSEYNKEELVIRIRWDGNRNVHAHEYTPIRDFMVKDYSVPEACRTCLNHPSNGGSGSCNCTLVLPTETSQPEFSFSQSEFNNKVDKAADAILESTKHLKSDPEDSKRVAQILLHKYNYMNKGEECRNEHSRNNYC